LKAGFKKLRTKEIEIINDDILKVNLDSIIRKRFQRKRYKLVSNIPYYITSPIIKLFLQNSMQPKLMVMLVQREVAERICASCGKLSVLAISVQVYGKPRIVEYVDRFSFYPVPKVDSAILKIEDIKRDFSGDYYKKFFRVVKIGFSSKRKKLKNNLSAGFCAEKKDVEKVLVEQGIDPNSRAQELSICDWRKLAEALNVKDQ